MRKSLSLLLAALLCMGAAAQDRVSFNLDWRFSLGDASSMEKDFTHGTEYFTYLSKVASTGHNQGPAAKEFDDAPWQQVTLPHDWVVDLPYSGEASHSHGYKCIGWKYPQNSVGWYRKHFYVPAEDQGKQISIEFEGTYRNCQVFCNGIYLGSEESGYLSHTYDLTDALDYGADNVITVRCDASLEEGWYYEGAGIYRNVYLRKEGRVALKPYTLKVLPDGSVTCEVQLLPGLEESKVSRRVTLLDADGLQVPAFTRRWSPKDPYLYTVRLELLYDGSVESLTEVPYGFRDIAFDGEKGFLLNGEPFKMKGGDVHLDAAGVGVGVPDELWEYRLLKLKEFGFNALRLSHNPGSPALLDACDRLGFLVIDENRQFGSSSEQLRQLEAMIKRDWNHPSIVLWSLGNEEWAVETWEKGSRMARTATDFVHKLDPSRPVTYGQCSAGYYEIADVVDVPGYNYIKQNKIDQDHAVRPWRATVGTEETSGAGTRGKYATVPENGWMLSLNLNAQKDTTAHAIEHGWQFYKERPWGAGIFYWTALDYRGEPNPMVWPATGSQFGILDYCGFPKDEAFYLQSWWTDKPVLHIAGPVEGVVTVYSNCESVTLFANGKSLGRKNMPLDGHLDWQVGKATSFKAKGQKKGFKPLYADNAGPSALSYSLSKTVLAPGGEDVVVVDIDTPQPEQALEVSVENAELLGWGNGDPGFKTVERPCGQLPSQRCALSIRSFSHKAQVLVRSLPEGDGPVVLHIGPESIPLR